MLKKIFIYLIISYQRFISPYKRLQACKFQPTCSQYMIDALRIHGVLKGGLLGLRRLSQCRPGSKYAGYDPVPKRHLWHTDIDTRIKD
jgi:hypothetical protein